MPEVRPSTVRVGESSRKDPIGSPPEWDFYMPRAPYRPWTHGRETLAYATFYRFDHEDVAVLRIALERWADEDLDIDDALRWGSAFSPDSQCLAGVQWEAAILPDQPGFVVTARFADGSFATTRVRSEHSPKSLQDLTVDLYLSSSFLLPAQTQEDKVALSVVGRQVGLMKAAALISNGVRLHTPPSDEFDERSWLVFATNNPFGWHIGPRDPQLSGQIFAKDSRLLRPADMAELVALRTDVQLLRGAGLIELDTDEATFMIVEKRPTKLGPLTPTRVDLARSEAKRLRRTRQLARATVLPTILDSVSTKALDDVLRNAAQAPTTVHVSTLEQQMAGLAALYAIAVLPDLSQDSSETVLTWRDSLADSLGAFHERIRELMVDSSSLSASHGDLREYMTVIGPQLDRDLHELRGQVRSSRLWKTTRERTPVVVGLSAAFALELMFAGRPLLAASALLQGTITQGLVNIAESLRRQRAIHRHPLYWRYEIDLRHACC